MTTYSVYRNGTGELEKRIAAALAHFRQSQGQDPASVTVHKSEADKARALGLACEVRGCGGCIVPEVWLQLPDRSDGDADPRQDGLAQGQLWEVTR